MRITETEMTSELTKQRAEFDPHRAADGNGGWVASWLPTRILTRNQAITAMIMAEFFAQGVTAEHELWPHMRNFAGELNLTAEQAVALIAQPPNI